MMQKKIARWLSFLAQRLNPQLIENQPIHAPIVGQLLSEKVALITGAAGQIGSAIAAQMAAQGAKLILVDINLDACNKIASSLGVSVIACFECDIANEKEIDSLCETLRGEHLESGDRFIVHILVHAAGVQFERSSRDPMQSTQWHQTYNTNVIGPAYLCESIQAKQCSTSEHTGLQSVLFISSIHEQGVVGWPSYSSSKAALNMLVKELAVEYAESGVRVNSIAPGWVANGEEKQPVPSRYALLKRQSIPPESVAHAAVFLSSEYCSSHTTGATLTIDGAMSLYNHRVDIEYTV